ncbi:RNA exonuclease 4 [Salpingoeca rosetta]|uniref:RNA exonuclease 4 n=1 Tax=Salpingoeca rosetta (strain ATCC 50818 / BSB-021) TaxID=946362 RepID=F2U2U8_SALR5|nr:RNA exonuclease 4 [Salpingoeca rosetta]EGD81942.1 RNA exonuclease 4 [Salpingoeca rosetta]|eukprot:XP_004996125.1 RNA exonuclease 4 [Salpingoeca rosetta]
MKPQQRGGGGGKQPPRWKKNKTHGSGGGDGQDKKDNGKKKQGLNNKRRKKPHKAAAAAGSRGGVPLDGMSNFERLMQQMKDEKKTKGTTKSGKDSKKAKTAAKTRSKPSNTGAAHPKQQLKPTASAAKKTASVKSKSTVPSAPSSTTPTSDQAPVHRKAGSAYENAILARVLAKVNDTKSAKWFEDEDKDDKDRTPVDIENGEGANWCAAVVDAKRHSTQAHTGRSGELAHKRVKQERGVMVSAMTTTTTTTSTSSSSNRTVSDVNGNSVITTTTTASASTTMTTSAMVGLTGGAKPSKLLAIDCEMVGVGKKGLRSVLARCSIVNSRGDVVVDTFVKPTEKVVDYRTHVSGVRPRHLTDAPAFEDVREHVSELVKGKILVGHAIKNDLKVLKLSHPRHLLRDTSIYKPFKAHAGGKRPALRRLAQSILGITLQDGEHDSVEDARAALRLYMHVKSEWESRESFKSRDPIAPALPVGVDADRSNSATATAAPAHAAIGGGGGGGDDDEGQSVLMSAMEELYPNIETAGVGARPNSTNNGYSSGYNRAAMSASAAAAAADKLLMGAGKPKAPEKKRYRNKHQQWRYMQKRKKRGLA